MTALLRPFAELSLADGNGALGASGHRLRLGMAGGMSERLTWSVLGQHQRWLAADELPFGAITELRYALPALALMVPGATDGRPVGALGTRRTAGDTADAEAIPQALPRRRSVPVSDPAPLARPCSSCLFFYIEGQGPWPLQPPVVAT